MHLEDDMVLEAVLGVGMTLGKNAVLGVLLGCSWTDFA